MTRESLTRRPVTAVGNEAVFERHPVRIGGFALHGRHVSATGRPSVAGWSAALEFASGVHEASPYWIGDLVAYGETRADWREKLSQAMSVTHLAEQTLHNLGYIARRVTTKARALAPSHGHAAEVAALEPYLQLHWLELATTEGWTGRDLRAQIKAAQRNTLVEGQAETMHTVDVTVRLSVEAATSWQAEEFARARVQHAIVDVSHAHVISAKALIADPC